MTGTIFARERAAADRMSVKASVCAHVVGGPRPLRSELY
jgi:hypothetical protein